MNVEQNLLKMKSHIPDFPNNLDSKLANKIQARQVSKPRIRQFKMVYAVMSVFIVTLVAGIILLLDNTGRPVIPSYGDPIVITNIGGGAPSISRIFYKWEIEGSQYGIDDEINMIIYFGHGYRPNDESTIKMLLKDLKISITVDAFEMIGQSEYVIEDFNSETYFIEEYWNENPNFEYRVTFKIKLKSLERTRGEIELIFDNYEEGYTSSEDGEPPRIITQSVYYVVDELGVLLSDVEPYTLYFQSMDRRYDKGLITQEAYINEVVPNSGDKIIINLAGVQTTLGDGSFQGFTLNYTSKHMRFSLNISKSYQELYNQYTELLDHNNAEARRTDYESYIKAILDLLLDNDLISESNRNQEVAFLSEAAAIELKEGVSIGRSIAHLYEKFPNYQPPVFDQYELK